MSSRHSGAEGVLWKSIHVLELSGLNFWSSRPSLSYSRDHSVCLTCKLRYNYSKLQSILTRLLHNCAILQIRTTGRNGRTVTLHVTVATDTDWVDLTATRRSACLAPELNKKSHVTTLSVPRVSIVSAPISYDESGMRTSIWCQMTDAVTMSIVNDNL